MGLSLSLLWSRFVGNNKEYRLLMLGLDAAGKTTLLYRLRLGEVITTVPTIGFNVERVTYKNMSFTVWDIGGQEKIRRLWKHYFKDNDALIFVVDSNDINRLDLAKKELHELLDNNDELYNITLLIFANKQDLPNAIRPSQLVDKLGLYQLQSNNTWYIQSCCATTGEGLYEGLDWLYDTLE